MGLTDSIITFAVGLVVGALGIHLGALFVLGESSPMLAVSTALLGAVVWSVAGHFFGWVPFLGIILTFIVWLGFINARYSGGLVNAGKIAAVAWTASIIADYLLKYLGLKKAHAVGVPEA